MHGLKTAAIISTALIGAMASSGAHAAAFVNGSFETGTDPGGGFINLGSGSTDITGWIVGGSSVDYIGGYWQAADGSRSVDLSGGGAGNIAQTFGTIAGRDYTVTYYLAGNPDGGPLTKTISVSASGNAAQTSTFNAAGKTHGAMGWVPVIYDFTAGGASTTLRFSSLTEGAFGPALDNISVQLSPVPEPAAWAMMLGGFGLAGIVIRRRRGHASIVYA